MKPTPQENIEESRSILFNFWKEYMNCKTSDARDMIIEKGIKEISDMIEQATKKEKERQWETMMSCLPSDAENLSLLTEDQAKRLIDCFTKKHPWD